VVGIQGPAELEVVMVLAALQLGATTLSVSKTVLENFSNKVDHVLAPNEAFMLELGTVQPLTTPEALADEDIVRISFSSGTTGIPKGIPFTAGALNPRTEDFRELVTYEPFMALLGVDTVTGFLSLTWSLFNGNPYFIPSGPAENLQVISEHGIRMISVSPARLENLLDEQESKQLPLKLEFVLTAGSMITPNLAKRTLKTLGAKMGYVYGSTEVGSASFGPYDESTPNQVGKLVSDVDFEIVNDDLDPLPRGQVGNIRYRKPSMPNEYWNSTSSRGNGIFEGWFYPGDQGSLTENNELVLLGRNDDLVNAAGSKFNLVQLDLWLQDSGLFADVASFTTSDNVGEVEIGIAFVAKQPPVPEILVKRLREFLPNLQVNVLLQLGAIPRNKMDKVVRIELQKLAKENNV
jgi:acyl-coenzyme A synthetase/AMP-(fatty) acid ligase